MDIIFEYNNKKENKENEEQLIKRTNNLREAIKTQKDASILDNKDGNSMDPLNPIYPGDPEKIRDFILL